MGAQTVFSEGDTVSDRQYGCTRAFGARIGLPARESSSGPERALKNGEGGQHKERLIQDTHTSLASPLTQTRKTE